MDNGASSYRRYLDGDDEGLVHLITEYKDGLIFYLNSIVDDLHVAEDLMQDTFFKLAVKKPRFNGSSAFKTWLYAIGRNIALDHLRKKRPGVSLDEVETYLHDVTSIEEDYIRNEEKLEVRRAMGSIKREHAEALWLVYVEELSYDDAAKVMKKSPKQFDSLIYRAKKSLKRELVKEVCVNDGI